MSSLKLQRYWTISLPSLAKTPKKCWKFPDLTLPSIWNSLRLTPRPPGAGRHLLLRFPLLRRFGRVGGRRRDAREEWGARRGRRGAHLDALVLFIYLYFYFFFLIISELLKALSACTVLLYLSSCTGHTCVSHKASFFCFLLGWCLSLSSSESTYLRTPGDKLSAIEESESASIYMLHTCVCIALCTYTVGTTKDWIQCAH